MQPPTKPSSMRACIGCGLLCDSQEWSVTDECPNCGLKTRGKNLDKNTSASFQGVIALLQPKKSWCSAWQKYKNNVPGMYCLDNLGEVTDEILEELEENKRPLPEWIERYKNRRIRDGR